MRKAALIASACLGLGALAGCTSGAKVNNSIAPPTSSTAAPTLVPSDVPTDVPTDITSSAHSVAQVGDPVTVTGNTDGEQLTVTLLRVVDPAYSTNQYESPDPGKRYVAFQLRITNSGSTVYDDSPGNCITGYTVNDEQTQDWIVSGITAGQMFAGGEVRLSPGESAVGYEVQQAPAGKIVRVQYTPDSGFSNDTAEWQTG